MTKTQIALFLKQLRKTSGLTANDVVNNLKSYDIDISSKTLYGYESGLSMPNADAFVSLCRIYKCDNPLDVFGTPTITSFEMEHIEKYRALDRYGQETISYILNRETERVNQLNHAATAPAATRIINYYYRLASAGTGQIIFDMPPTKRIEIPAIPEYRKADYAIGVNGNSMEPVYHDGDTLLVEMTDTVEIGEIGIFLVNGESFVKERGKTELISLNPESKNIPLNEDARCLGKVIGKIEE